MAEHEDSYNKPKFDGRLEYYKVLKEYLTTFGIAQIQNNYTIMLRTIEGMYFMSFPFIRKANADNLKKDITKAWQLVAINKKNTVSREPIRRELEHLMFKMKEDVFFTMKDLLLPVNEIDPEHDEKSFIEQFERESDL